MLAITAGICGLAAVLAVIVLPRTHPVGSPGEKGADLEDAAGRLDQCPLTPRRLTRHLPDCASGKRRGRAPRSVPRASASSGNRAITRPPPSRSPQQRRFPRPPSSVTSPPRNGLSCPTTSSPRCSPRWPSSPPTYRCSPRSIGPSGTDWHNWNATTSRSAESSSPPFPNCALRNSTTSGAPSNCSRGPSPGGLVAPPVTSRSASSPARLPGPSWPPWTTTPRTRPGWTTSDRPSTTSEPDSRSPQCPDGSKALMTHNETGASQPIIGTRLDSGTPWPSLPDVCRRLRAGQLWYECETTGWLGLADEIPLTEVAAELGQQLQGGGVLNYFGHDAQTEGVAEVNGRANEVEGASTVAVGEPSDEDSIEFEFLHRQAAEVGE